MRTTASYDIFPDTPSERALAKARYLAREGKVDDALAAYRGVMADQPAVRAPWTEAFDLLRHSARREEALELAEGAERQFPKDAFPLALKGAALAELGRIRDALAALEQAVERDPDLALTWHELGYAAFRLGDRTRALMALDRAFSLEPHAATLRLRGRVLRDAGRYAAAEVAFEGAAEAAEHDMQRDECRQEVEATRRYALFAPRRPDKLTVGERRFADTGTVVLAAVAARTPPSDGALVDGFALLARDCGWRFGQLVVSGGPNDVWKDLADRLGVVVTGAEGLDVARVPLVASARGGDDAEWRKLVGAIRDPKNRRGAAFVLEAGAAPTLADVVGALSEGGKRLPLAVDPAHALTQAQHPSATIAGRSLS